MAYQRFFFLLWMMGLAPTLGHALCSDALHSAQDYVDFAIQQPGADAVCLVVDEWLHSNLTGVLIAPTKVLTAAHGFSHGNQDTSLKMGRIYVHFGPNSQDGVRYTVKAVRIHSAYTKAPRHEKGKYDFAILELDRPVKGVEPIKPTSSFTPHWDKDQLVVITFGSFDWTKISGFPKRAFAVPEVEVQPLHEYDSQLWLNDQNVMVGSIFFRPDVLPHDQTETTIRSNRAVKRWHELGKPPYALALPGSSGSPLLRMVNGKAQLVGLVSGFTHLALTQFQDPGGSEEALLIVNQNKEDVVNRYQTQFSLLYQRKENVKKGESWHLDPGLVRIIN